MPLFHKHMEEHSPLLIMKISISWCYSHGEPFCTGVLMNARVGNGDSGDTAILRSDFERTLALAADPQQQGRSVLAGSEAEDQRADVTSDLRSFICEMVGWSVK